MHAQDLGFSSIFSSSAVGTFVGGNRRKEVVLYEDVRCLFHERFSLQGEECQKRCEQLAKDYPELAAETTLIRATQLAREGKVKEAATLLEDASKKLKDKQIDMRLASVQLLLAEVRFLSQDYLPPANPMKTFYY